MLQRRSGFLGDSSIYPGKRRLRIDDLTRRRGRVLGDNYTGFWHDFRKTVCPVAGRLRLRWQQDNLNEFGPDIAAFS